MSQLPTAALFARRLSYESESRKVDQLRLPLPEQVQQDRDRDYGQTCNQRHVKKSHD
jgi:hypothetical protein